MAGSHFTGPVLQTNHQIGTRQFFSNMPVFDDPDYTVFRDDFLMHFDTNIWAVIKDAGAAVALVADALNGEITISSAATTDDDGGLFQTEEETYKFQSGKEIWAEAKVKNSDADQTDFYFGFATVVATNPENILTTGDRVGFQINDGDASIICKTEKDGTETSTDSGSDLSDSTYVKLGIHYDGAKVEFYIDRILVATHTANIVDDENLDICGFHLSGNATGTRTSTWDYVMVVAER